MQKKWRPVMIIIIALVACASAISFLWQATRYAPNNPPPPHTEDLPRDVPSPLKAGPLKGTPRPTSIPQNEPRDESSLSDCCSNDANPKRCRAAKKREGIKENCQAKTEVQATTQVADEDQIEQSLRRLKEGSLAYNTPEKMKSGETAHVIARIGSGKISMQTLEAGLPTDPGTKTETAVTPVSAKMKMTLKGADFDITPLSSEEQIVAGDTPTQWEWDIVPKHSGKLRLHLAAVVELNKLSRDFTTVDREIEVHVDPVEAAGAFAKANGVWILTTLGAGIAALWAWLKRRGKAKHPGWETP